MGAVGRQLTRDAQGSLHRHRWEPPEERQQVGIRHPRGGPTMDRQDDRERAAAEQDEPQVQKA